MYLRKAKRRGNATIADINKVDCYLDYLNRDEKYKDSTLKEWCGLNEEDIPMELVPLYKDDYVIGEWGYGSIWTEVGYWRKANAIHKWFVDNVQDGVDECDTYEVSKEQLLELATVCLTVLDSRYEDNAILIADDLLPTESGFFFGSTEYDEWYYEGLGSTIDIINKVCDITDFEKEIVTYHASW